jgi:hypothetical protein
MPSVEPVADYPAGQPIPNGPDVPTYKQSNAIYATWANRVIVDEYRRFHPKDTDVLTFLGDVVGYLSHSNKEQGKDLSRRGEGLERSGANDPAFLLMAAIVTEDKYRREKLYRMAVTGFQNGGYSAILLFMSAGPLAMHIEDRNGDASQIGDADRIALDALKSGLNNGSFRPDEMSVLRGRMCSPAADSLIRRQGLAFGNIFGAANNLPDWIRELGQGIGYFGAAWQARTGGWASEVTEEGWNGWGRNLAEARKHLTKAWELNPKDPTAAAYMVGVAMGDEGDKEEMRHWFDRSVAAQMDFGDAYQRLLWGLRPRWGGTHEEMLQFADECLRTGRFDTCVPHYYLKTVGDIASENNSASIYDRPEILHNCRLALAKYFETPDMPLSPTYAHTLAAFLDYRTGNIAGAKAHLAAIEYQADRGVGSALFRDLPQMLTAVRAQ